MIRNEDGQLVGFVFVDVGPSEARVSAFPNYVDRAKQVLADKVDVPKGYRIAWADQFKSFERAKARPQILEPMTVFLIFFMLFMHRGWFIETLIVMLTIPFSLVGSIWLLWFLGYKLSVAVAVGMIALAGLAVELGLLMMLYLDTA